ncbi:hypothetical protein THUN1379_26020 [Paludibacterium sp. THUN1379]|nr:hypothetical protein THUN1379_26020 [Paludibacterium sp. THUN1379]
MALLDSILAMWALAVGLTAAGPVLQQTRHAMADHARLTRVHWCAHNVAERLLQATRTDFSSQGKRPLAPAWSPDCVEFYAEVMKHRGGGDGAAHLDLGFATLRPSPRPHQQKVPQHIPFSARWLLPVPMP